MDKTSVVGLALGVATIVVGQVLEGGHVASLIQPTAMLIVLAHLLQAPPLLAVAFVVQYVGLLAERWFFFAQANHPQNLYYQTIS
jgi:flagellar motor component MotA